MADTTEVIEKTIILFTSPQRQPHELAFPPRGTVAEFAAAAAKTANIDLELEVYLENADTPLGRELILVEHLTERFAPLHVAPLGVIEVRVQYNNKHVEDAFSPSTTIGRIIEWAVKKLDLEGKPTDYQAKYEGEVLSADDHLGQIAHHKKQVELALVFKIKPQG